MDGFWARIVVMSDTLVPGRSSARSIAAAVIVLGGSPILLSGPAAAATKVPTQTIIVPSDPRSGKDADPSRNTTEDKLDAAEPSIPDDALSDPSASPAPATTADDKDNSDEDAARALLDRATPNVQTDLTKLPAPVLATRNRILEAAKTGIIANLRPLIGEGEDATTLSFGGLEGDPIEFMKENSGDDDGYEILAILVEILEMGYVVFDRGTEDELYVWPYFFALPFDKMTPAQKVELYHVLTAGDVQDSIGFGSYIFYRVGIKPDGTWQFFVAGD
ncbi:MAG: cytoplasmic protein [Pseudomonadota bacterium]